MKDVVVVSACRTAIGSFGGTLRDTQAGHIAAAAMQAAIQRAGIDAAMIDDVRFGCCMEPADSLNVSRVAALLAGIPDTVTAMTINRVCISGMEAVVSGMAMIQAGMADIVLAGGVEHMSGVAYHVPKARWGCRLQDQVFVDALTRALHCGSHIIPHPETAPMDATRPPLSLFKGRPYLMGHTAEFVAQHLDISRREMDEVALRSNHNAERATMEGAFKAEIAPMEISRRGRPPVFIPETGKVTAGNSSGINDGAAALVIMSAEKAAQLSLTPLARIRAVGRGACHPALMTLSPVPAVRQLLKNSGLRMNDFELIELNEAFAAQYIACERQLDLDHRITNVNGSGIGLGHPVGATGARILVTLIHGLRRQGKSLGLATLCGGGGIAMACALEIP
jgi:acetyl-CoA C-acetyltransferase